MNEEPERNVKISVLGKEVRINNHYFLGYFAKDFEVLKKLGGVIVDDNKNWPEINTVIGKIRHEQSLLINSPKEIRPEIQRERLRVVINEAFERAIATTPEEQNSRKLVIEALQNFEPEYVRYFDTKLSLLEDTSKLIHILKERGTAFLYVDFVRFYKVVHDNKKLNWNYKPAYGNHAVALVGYSVSKNN